MPFAGAADFRMVFTGRCCAAHRPPLPFRQAMQPQHSRAPLIQVIAMGALLFSFCFYCSSCSGRCLLTELYCFTLFYYVLCRTVFCKTP